jgi:hypothetical protein
MSAHHSAQHGQSPTRSRATPLGSPERSKTEQTPLGYGAIRWPVAVGDRDLGVLGGLPQNRRRDYCSRCQAVQEGHLPLGRPAPPPRPGQGGAGRGRTLFLPACWSSTAHLPASLGRRAAVWCRGRGGPYVTDERRPRPNTPPRQPPVSDEEFRRAGARDRLSLREDPERRRFYQSGTCRVPGRPAMTRPRNGITAARCSPGTARRSRSMSGRSAPASGSRHCCSGVARAGQSSRCLPRRQDLMSDLNGRATGRGGVGRTS